MKLEFTRLLAVLAVAVVLALPAASQEKPSIPVIWGDDVGWSNISAYNHGMMGYRTPNIARIAREGALFTDSARAAEQLIPRWPKLPAEGSCGPEGPTAGTTPR
jgi:hypothetical protein